MSEFINAQSEYVNLKIYSVTTMFSVFKFVQDYMCIYVCKITPCVIRLHIYITGIIHPALVHVNSNLFLWPLLKTFTYSDKKRVWWEFQRNEKKERKKVKIDLWDKMYYQINKQHFRLTLKKLWSICIAYSLPQWSVYLCYTPFSAPLS